MKKIFTVLVALCVLFTMLSGCGNSDRKLEEFTSTIAGIWQRNGNLQDMRLEILDDGNWTNQELRDGEWEIIDQGIITYDKEYKMFTFETEEKYYPIEFSSDEGEVLHYKNDNYYREDESSQTDTLDDAIYIGEYLDLDTDEPGLEIAKFNDEEYIVQIGIFRLTTLSDGIGVLTPSGMLFTATDASGDPISGIITVEDQIATVMFTDSTWDLLENGSVFLYIKSSDTPNLWSE